MRTYRPLGTIVTRTAVVLGSVVAGVGVSVPPALAASYACPLTATAICDPPLTGTAYYDVALAGNGDGYAFDLDGNGSRGYIEVGNSSQINMSAPSSFSVQVKGVGVPSTAVGDYDVVRGTPDGNWKLEVVAKNSRTTAKAACFYKGVSGKGNAVGGPDLSKATGWTTITCQNTGTAVRLSINGSVVKTVSVSTGNIPNPGPLLLGAKNTTGGDQFSGYAKDLRINGS